MTTAAIIFGGTGFIGTFFARLLLDEKIVDLIYLVDLEPLEAKPSRFRRDYLKDDPRVRFIQGDVRHEICDFELKGEVRLIANFAAIHREPGHQEYEYFEANILGAERICSFAEKVRCNSIIFSSSISVYGVSESAKDEDCLPIPVTAYGSSKLAAEKVHQIWQAKDTRVRRLVIVRPGVVFGPGEGGNVSRLVKAVIGHYFCFMGNQSTRKAGVYVKELCSAILWVLQERSRKGEGVILFNMSMNPGPSIAEYVGAVCRTQGIRRFIPSVPYIFLIWIAYAIDAIARPCGVNHPFSPLRVRKLVRSNNIVPTYLIVHGYQFKYSLESAFADWKDSCPEEWS